MERSPFEHKIQSFFKNRTIRPSEQTWTQLEELLDEQESNKKIFPIFWMRSIAVCIVLLVMVFFVFRNVENTNEDVDLVALDTVLTDVNEIVPPGLTRDDTVIDVQEEIVSTLNNTHLRETRAMSTPLKIKDKEFIADKVEAGEGPLSQEANFGLQNKDEEKVKTEVAFTKELAKEPKSSISIEASRLLAAVDQGVSANGESVDTQVQNPKFRVDAEKLLAEVEEEEIKTFMNRLTETLISKSGDLIAGYIRGQDQ